MNPTRRELLQRSAAVASLMGGLSLLPEAAQAAWNAPAFEAKSLPEAMKALGLSAPAESADVTLTAPDIAENGAVVQVACACHLPGVKRLMVLVEKNPAALSALFEVTEFVEPNFTVRVKMGQTSHITAVGRHGQWACGVCAQGSQGHAGWLRRLRPAQLNI